MNLHYIVGAVLITVALFLGMDANDRYAQVAAVEADNQALDAELQRLAAQRTVLERVQQPMPTKYAADALSEFFSRALEAGEVLGAGVRIETREGTVGQPRFTELKYGLQVAPVSIQAATELTAAAAVLAMIDDELAALPISVRAVRARVQQQAITVRLDVDVFGRSR